MMIQNVTPCSLVHSYKHFDETCIHLHGGISQPLQPQTTFFSESLIFPLFFILKCYTRAISRSPLFRHVLNLQFEVQLTVTLSHNAWFPLIAADYLHPATTASLLSHKEQKNKALFYSCTGSTSTTTCRNIHIITICHEKNATGGRRVLILHDICH
jgi:hypothetical protein